MNLSVLLTKVRDELDAQQIAVRFEETVRGVIVHANDYVSKVIAKSELRSRGVTVLDQ